MGQLTGLGELRYLDKEGKVYNQFLDLVLVMDGKADTIVSAVKTVLLKTEKLYGLGTDGAAVMTGHVNGVAKQLKDSYPKLVAVACAAHKLALACKDASNNVPYMATFRDHLQDLYPFFHNSANRTATLKAASLTLGVNDLKVKAGQTPIPGSFLSQLHEDLEDPDKLGAFKIKYEAERGRRGQDVHVQDQLREVVGGWGFCIV
ncbi:hypothetical protein ACEWY4_012542 [Coilia grayii]|uniref:DUF4371 domain-containing protein n=1 Tax=Coilia grayii TaxID=363190 RepID=A0ABD1K0U1_9TELE